MVEINLAILGEEAQPIFISANLSSEIKQALIGLLRELKDAFKWTYVQMPRLDL